MKNNKKYKGIVAIDLFAGAGGLSRGLLDAGINVIAGIDLDHTAQETYEHNNKSKFIYKDIRDVTGNDIFELLKGYEDYYFLLAGCAPCQAFSTRNHRQKDVDERRSLLLEFERLVRETNPDFVFMENVPGIKKREPHVYQEFEDTLHDNSYSVEADVVNTKYFEVPQDRKRFVLFASRHNEITFPKHIIEDEKFLTVKDTIFKLPKINAGETHPKLINHSASNLEEINIRRLKQTPHNGGGRFDWTDESLVPPCHKGIKGFGNSYGRLSWDKPAPTITTKFYTYSSGRHGHPEQDRAMSFKEGALLQSFPNDYIFFGSSVVKGRQIGNAVPPKMAYHFGKHFLNFI
ncbi:MAG TPA: DNA cytosine methyltransferase [Sulfurospirillum arcachonense]|nr:DNA cytosine methyltransferase [Sulfurospirillum arcachonense]